MERKGGESVSSIDDYDNAVNRLPSRFVASGSVPREKILRRLDGVLSLRTRGLNLTFSWNVNKLGVLRGAREGG